MKKLILFLFAFSLAVAASAQFMADTGYDALVKDNQSAYFFTGGAQDVIGEGDSTLTKTVFINTHDEVIADVYVGIDSISAGAAISIYFKGKQFPDDTYTAIDTVDYSMTADTTFTFTSTSAQKYRYWQISMEAPADSIEAKLSKAYFKFWK
jgi:hypothetical protein